MEGASDDSTAKGLVFSIGGKGFAWTYFGKVGPKKPRVAFLDVLAVYCTIESKDILIEAAPHVYFTDDHYRGFPAALVRLNRVGKKEFAACWRTPSYSEQRRNRGSASRRSDG